MWWRLASQMEVEFRGLEPPQWVNPFMNSEMNMLLHYNMLLSMQLVSSWRKWIGGVFMKGTYLACRSFLSHSLFLDHKEVNSFLPHELPTIIFSPPSPTFYMQTTGTQIKSCEFFPSVVLSWWLKSGSWRNCSVVKVVALPEDRGLVPRTHVANK